MKATEKGRLFVISGPSGVGKGTILAHALAALPEFGYSVSATTRSPRPGEENGVQYHFLSEADFEALIAAGGFLEYTTYHGHRYGTPREYVLRELELGRSLVLEIEVDGAVQIKAALPEAVLVFVLPPDLTELRRRLAGRHTDSSADMRRRLDIGLQELRLAHLYDYLLVNDEPVAAAKELTAILTDAPEAKAHSAEAMKPVIEKILNEVNTTC